VVDSAFRGDRRVFFASRGGPVSLDEATGTVSYMGRQFTIPPGWRILGEQSFEGLETLRVTEFGRP
jgi:hypothetical protein